MGNSFKQSFARKLTQEISQRVAQTICSVASFVLALAFIFVLDGCGQDLAKAPAVGGDFANQGNGATSEPSNGSSGANPISPSPVTPLPDQNLNVYKVEMAPLWDRVRPKEASLWTQHAFSVVDKFGVDLMNGTSDIRDFCPTYLTLTRNEKINFWVYLVSAIVKYESDFNPVSRFEETTLGTDSVTQRPVWSEGLLQLSYQDSTSYTFCNEFNWKVDQNLSAADPTKTILEPIKNLTCGIRILNEQVKKKDLIATRGYWSTLFPTGANISSIRALARQQSYCL